MTNSEKFVEISKEKRPLTLWLEEDGTLLCHREPNNIDSGLTKRVYISKYNVNMFGLLIPTLMDISHQNNENK